MERKNPLAADSDANWASNDGVTRNGKDANGNALNGTPKQTNSASLLLTATPTPTITSTPTRRMPATVTPTPTATPTAARLLITEVLYDGTQTDEGDEFIEIFNSHLFTVNLSGYKIGDEETRGGSEGMYVFPTGASIRPNAVIVVARNAAQFRARFGFDPHFELVTTGAFTDTASVPNLARYTAWASGSLSLSNSGDEVLLLGPGDQIVDAVAWGDGNFAAVGLTGDATAPAPKSLQRCGMSDANQMTFDFLRGSPSPFSHLPSPAPPLPIPGRAMPNGMFAYWGDLHAHSTTSDGSGPPRLAFATARAAGLHFFGLADHDSWLTSEEWNEMGNAARDATVDGAFVALRGFEYTHKSKGHINVFNTDTWVSRDDPAYDTLAEFYTWLGGSPDAVAQFNHPDWQRGGDFDDLAFNAAAADKIVLLEVGNNASSIYAQYEAQYISGLNKRWRIAPTNNSDNHGLTWGNDSLHRVGIIAPALTQANLLDALRARRVFATEDANLAITLQASGAWMGATIRAQPTITFTVTVSDPDNEPIQLFLYDNDWIARVQPFANSNAIWTVAVPGGTAHHYFVRAIQGDGNIAYTAPIWTDNTPVPIPVPTEEPRERTWDLGRVSIETARTTQVGKRVELEGCVIVPPGVISDRYIFIQDETAGIKIHLPSSRGDFPALSLHDRVGLRGVVQGITGEREVEIEDVATIQARGVCAPVPPTRYATGMVNRSLEGRLVEVSGTLVSWDRSDLTLNDGSGNVLVYIDSTTRIRLPRLVRGQLVRVIGVVSRTSGDTAILPRYASDLIFTLPPTPTRTRALPTPRPTVTLARTRTPTRSPTPRATSTVTATVRVYVRPTATPTALAMTIDARAMAQLAATIDARAVAQAGGSASIAASAVCFAIALMLWRQR
jgi:uncharacterized protein YdeI (BOF family)